MCDDLESISQVAVTDFLTILLKEARYREFIKK